MSHTCNNNKIDCQTSATAPSIQFSADTQDLRGRDHSAHPINGGSPLAQVDTSDSTKSECRRSSLAAFADRLRSKSRSHSRSHSRGRNSLGGGASGRNSLDERRSSTSSETNDQYAEVIKAQALFMEKLRAEQEMNGITTNCDGLPIPPASMDHGRRRSSVTQILGLDKHLLAR
ncbi:hypothetical protein EMPS_02910 [Entomortierella parvispora]|uniref:Uncharacterized protein n=1 Tax=Entomortierella parvispora TaxID=205924 RepID=A0A9P3H5N0_9FUNG|nr:hypothetical protein EMPS_02910 [Entomortierella parvispora]